MITPHEFKIYERIRHSGATNMFDMRAVIFLSHGVLTPEKVIYIMKNYEELVAKNLFVSTINSEATDREERLSL